MVITLRMLLELFGGLHTIQRVQSWKLHLALRTTKKILGFVSIGLLKEQQIAKSKTIPKVLFVWDFRGILIALLN